MRMLRELQENEFKSLVLESAIPVVIKVYAEWCPPCKQMAPGFQSVAKEFADKVSFYELNVDIARNLAVQLGIASIPTTLFIKDGRILAKELGYMPKDVIAEKVQSLLAS
jgi:thioredoxin 1